jgi:hypothetical protein
MRFLRYAIFLAITYFSSILMLSRIRMDLCN